MFRNCVVRPEGTSFCRYRRLLSFHPLERLWHIAVDPLRFELSPDVSSVADRLNLQFGTRNPALSSSSGSAQLVPVGNQQAIACLYFCASCLILNPGSRSWSKVTREVLIGEAGDADREEGIGLALRIGVSILLIEVGVDESNEEEGWL